MTAAASRDAPARTRYHDLLARASDLRRALAEVEGQAALRPRAPALRDRLTHARNRAAAAVALVDFITARGLPMDLASRATRRAAARVETLRVRLDSLDVAELAAVTWPAYLPLATSRPPRRR